MIITFYKQIYKFIEKMKLCTIIYCFFNVKQIMVYSLYLKITLMLIDTLLIEIFTCNIITTAITFTSNNISGNNFRLVNTRAKYDVTSIQSFGAFPVQYPA